MTKLRVNDWVEVRGAGNYLRQGQIVQVGCDSLYSVKVEIANSIGTYRVNRRPEEVRKLELEELI